MGIDRVLSLNLINVNWSVELDIFIDSTQDCLVCVCVVPQSALLLRRVACCQSLLHSLVLKKYLVVLLVDQDNALLQVVQKLIVTFADDIAVHENHAELCNNHVD